MDANGDSLAFYGDLDQAGRLPLRLRVAPWCQPGIDAEGVRTLIGQQGAGGRLWRTAGVKIFMDGTVDNGTAWLEQPDCHGESRHAFWPDPEEYTRVIGELHRAGVPTATHAIGDAAVRHVLDAVEKAQAGADAGCGTGSSTSRPSRTTPCAGSPSSASWRPCSPPHCCDFTRADHTDNWSRRLGRAARLAGLASCRDLHDSRCRRGPRLPTGPSPPYPPLGVMAGARHRRPTRHLGRDPHGPEQALTALEALRGMTVNAAYAAGEEDEAGRIAVGHRADLTVLAADPLTVPATELADVPVLLTVLDGDPDASRREP
ncbi:amidohydrolase family protein [Streptomyces thinghirensis]|nr:amidohydrolase family protein [Streptomyces thinghirensis]